MYSRSVYLAAALSALGAQALSSGCTGQIGALALLGDLGSCLQLTSALGLLSASGSIVGDVNSYLGSLCADSTPTCSNSTLTSAQSTISSACSSDLAAGGTDATEVKLLQALLQSYPQVKTAACAKNSTTDQYCAVNALYTIQNVTGTEVSTSFVTGVLTGSSTDAFDKAVSSGQLCTGCVGEIYQQAVQANSSVADTSVARGLQQQCGANFASSSPTGVSTPSAASTSQAAAASSSSGAAVFGANVNFIPYAVAGSTVVLGALFGGAALL
ncbi:hypothetical protein DB88DRAFT_492900 [Papiliotrema laurentii]|uniref:DUF7729 domain-containing protein n=1 Tax=Papiliotrema laurentii TaxID=5418 RepID=A0AAD9FNY1_PAPLA|nr:hypothetical protein DB88DRAFT_492900 [Papiliotrema laurentii]